jgi:DNA-binding NarL/FixJ family response regulator
MRILIADDHQLVRSGLKLILAQVEPQAQIIEAADGREAVTMARRHAPELILLDITMPGLNGIDALPRLLAVAPGARILVLSMHTERHYVTQALKHGAQGYLVKDSAVEELADAIKVLREGRPFLSRCVGDALLADYVRGGSAEAPPATGHTHTLLTPRQREVLQLVAEGRSTREIAERLHLSVKTVETHRAEVMRRLDIFDVAGLTRYAIREGLVPLER